MSHGIALALLLALGADERSKVHEDLGVSEKKASEVWVIDGRAFRFPVQVTGVSEIRELSLQVSTDNGRSWRRTAVIDPESDGVPFYAPTDGLYRFRIRIVSKTGEVSYSPHQRVRVQTVAAPGK